MKTLPWKVMTTFALASSLLLTSACSNEKSNAKKDTKEETEKSSVSVPVTDYTFDTAGNMFAYAEFELSGEPLVEGLGLDLDVLDVRKLDQPSKFDYIAGVESYEYSEEAMYEVTEKSGLGLHLIHGPAVAELAKKAGKDTPTMLGERFYELADSVGYPKDELFRNMFPTLIEYSSGDPHYIQTVDTNVYAENDDDSYVPIYQVNFETLRWDRAKMNKTLNPSAYGATFLKQALWAGDFMGGLHKIDSDEELEASTPKDDDDVNIALGVSSADGMQGVILTEQIWNKLTFIRDGLFYDAVKKQLTAGTGSQYNPTTGLVYLPHEIEVEEDGHDEMPNAKQLTVKDERSMLQDQWLMLWPASEFYGMTDQRPENKEQNPAFLAAFDGKPFQSAALENVDSSAANDVKASDPYSINRDVLLQVFKNIDAMHYNNDAGAFIDEHDGKTAGAHVDTFQAGYTIEALRMFQRAIDGLPVGYANGEDAKGLVTEEGKRALEMIKRQADFIIKELKREDGLVAKGYTIGKGQDDSEPTLDAQLGAIRGLTGAFLATKETKYRDAARELYQVMDERMLDKETKLYYSSKGEMKYNPMTAGALTAVFRVALNNLYNADGDQDILSALDRETIISRYVAFYDTVIDGPSLQEGMQASEFWDTGDAYIDGQKPGNTDKDTVPQVQAGHGEYGIAPVLVNVDVKKR